MTSSKTAKLIATTLVIALGISAQAAQAKGTGQYKSNGSEQRVGLLLPAVQSARPSSSNSSQEGSDLLIINNGDGSDFFEFEIRKFFRNLAPRE